MSFNSPNKPSFNKVFSGLLSGGLASIMTQPLEVIKTIILINPSKSPLIEQGYSFSSLKASCSFIYSHQNQGFRNFFKGGMAAFIRQSFGFALYTLFIDIFDCYLNEKITKKPIKNSISALFAKTIAVLLTTPLILIKTRLELITQKEYTSIQQAFIRIISQESVCSLFTGVTSVLSRELTFSMFHYSFYRYLIDSDKTRSNYKLVFMSYSAGIWAIIFSHPFEVVRNRIMIQKKDLVEEKKYKGLYKGLVKIVRREGIRGFFKGILPRLVRKPINSAIVWSFYEYRNRKEINN